MGLNVAMLASAKARVDAANSYGYEYLLCQACGREWSRLAGIRGRKPIRCMVCREFDNPVSPRLRPRRSVSSLVEISDSGMSAAGFAERNDCTVRALANATGKSYAEAHEFMRLNGRKKGKGAQFRDVIYRNKERALGCKIEMVRLAPARGIKKAMALNPVLRRGVWIIKMRQHVATLRDGKLIDSFDSSRKDVLYAWLVQPE